MMTHAVRCLVFAAVGFVWLIGCSQPDSKLGEKENPNYLRGQDLLKQGREEEAMEEFLQVLDEITEAPQTHLELGRLFLKVDDRKDPLQAIYHFRRFLYFRPDAREAKKVQGLIPEAEKQFLAALPGKPFADQLEAMQLRERNQALERQLVSLQARLARHEPNVEESPDTGNNPNPGSLGEAPEDLTVVSPKQEEYLVKERDTLSSISFLMYGSSAPLYIDAIYEANRQTMLNKNSLRVGQRLALPKVTRP